MSFDVTPAESEEMKVHPSKLLPERAIPSFTSSEPAVVMYQEVVQRSCEAPSSESGRNGLSSIGFRDDVHRIPFILLEIHRNPIDVSREAILQDCHDLVSVSGSPFIDSIQAEMGSEGGCGEENEGGTALRSSFCLESEVGSYEEVKQSLRESMICIFRERLRKDLGPLLSF